MNTDFKKRQRKLQKEFIGNKQMLMIRGNFDEKKFEMMWKFRSIENYFVKPKGGLWTSSFEINKDRDNEFPSDWYNWCCWEMPQWIGNKALLFDVYKDAKIFHINSMKDLEELFKWYPRIKEPSTFSHTIDFESIAKDWDAIHLTWAGQAETRWSTDGSLAGANLYGWDCESTLWFRNCFKSHDIISLEKFNKQHNVYERGMESEESVDKFMKDVKSGKMLKRFEKELKR
jgi:hypothetical protein